jgi:hypothetical protein
MIAPGHTYDFLVRVPRSATRLEIRFPDVVLGAVQNPFTGDALEIYVHSAKRGGAADYRFVPWVVEPGVGFVYDWPEPGTMRVTLAGSFTNWSPVAGSCEIHMTTERFVPDHDLWGRLRLDGAREHTITVPEGVAALGAVLQWHHDWTTFPTYDLELVARHDSMTVAATTIDSPERLLVEAPAPGTWTLRVLDAGTIVRGHEDYRLLVKLFDVAPGDGALDWLAAAGEEHAPGTTGIATATSPTAPLAVGVHPSPTRGATTITFELASSAEVAIDVYAASGRHVRTLHDGAAAAGRHTVRWDGRTADGARVARGVYFVRVATGEGMVTRKLLVDGR